MTLTADPRIDAVAGILPTIAARASEIEAARRLPLDLLDELVGAGCFGVVLPVSHGGRGGDLPAALNLFESVAVADGSAGWTVMIGASAWCDVASLPRATFDSLYAGRDRTILAGAFNPMGASITPGEGGYRVTGRWSFASGCEHADWLFGNCIEGFADGGPKFRAAVFSPDQVTIEDTWHVSGLCGTGSHHFSVDDLFVPAERTFVPMVDHPALDEPIVRVAPPVVFGLGIASVAIGIARGAIEEIVALATGKVPLLAREPLAANSMFQREFAAADTDLRAARLLLQEVAGEVWLAAVAGEPLTLEQRARTRSAAVWVVERAVAIVETAYRNGGGSSLYLESPLQRRLRDIHAVSQHFLVKRDTLTTAGAILAGQEVQLTVF
ncbi:MAG: acyl-CoA dehydrogenase family protein [Acidimicrobiales bacterium]|nr:acyl-CoA dehydrogenase family protein [Acidimicrobiales bacterium]